MGSALPAPAELPVSRWAAFLGYAGLLPFVALAVAAWLGPLSYRGQSGFALLAYGASIASFLGAIHWGLWMRGPLLQAPLQLVWGILPSLVAWSGMLMPLHYGLLTLALLLVICMGVDWRIYPVYGLDKWLMMRLHLTWVAAVCLVIGGVAI